MSYHTLNTRPLNLALASYLKRGAHLGVGLGAMAPMLALANPSGGQVVGGQANISNPGANGVVVKQTSQSAIINWQQFNIGQGQYVQFIQPSSSSVVLNRVVGGGASSIFGSLTGNGQVFLVNSNGVYFGKSATLDLQGFLASTLDISDGNFLAGHYVFDQAGAPGATITNEGKLRAHKGGYIILAGDYAQNDGLIAAQSGHVILASGAKTTLNLNGNQLVNFAVNQATLASYAGVTNTGKLIADGGTVLMTADVANALKATVVNNSGLIEAHAINKNGGTIQLLASGGNIQNAGTLDANATKAGIQGGAITLKGDEKTILTPTSNITALGDAANGGQLEVSGNTIAVKGNVSLGKRGSLLMDPGHVQISSGNANSGGPSIGSSATTGFGKVGVTFIESQLHNNTDVTIAAGTLISASGAAKTKGITEATGTGNLKLLVGHGGDIELEGLNIAIAGRFNASVFNAVASHSHNAFMSFGRIQAKSISINAGTSNVELAAPAVISGVLHPSLKATGSSVAITAGNIGGISGGDINLTAKNAVVLHGQVSNAGNVTMAITSASGEGIFAGKIVSGKNITLTASHLNPISSGGLLDISAASNLTVKGKIGTTSNHMFGALTLEAGKTISVDHGIYTSGTSNNGQDIHINAKHLAYTGAGVFTISAGYGNLFLDAGIGSAAHPVTFGVNLVDHGYGLFIERSIYTAGGITAAEHTNSGNSGKGVFVRAGSDGSASTANVNNTTHATSASSLNVTLKAGGNVALSGFNVDIGGGRAFANASGSGGAATAKNTVSIAAGKNATFSGANVNIHAGTAEASIASDSKSTVTATADTSVTVHAGGTVQITASNGFIGGGNAQVNDRTHAVKQSATASATADVSITAGGAIKTAGSFMNIDGGHSVAQKTTVKASQSSAKATAVAHGDVSLSAPTISLNANRISVQGGSRVGGIGFGHATCSGSCSVSFSTVDIVRAKAKNATANLTATGNVTLSATGNVTLTDIANGVFVSGGYGAGEGISVSAGNQGGAKAAADAESKVAITAGGNVTLKGAQVNLRGGRHVAGNGTVSFSGSFRGSPTSGSHAVKALAKSGKGGSATLTADASVKISAGHNIAASASNNLTVAGGGNEAIGASVLANSSSAKAAIAANVGVSFTAGGGMLLSGHHVSVRGGSNAAGAGTNSGFNTCGGFCGLSFVSHSGSVQAIAGGKNATADLTALAGVALKAGGGGITLMGMATGVSVDGGSHAGQGIVVSAGASGGAKASADVDAHFSLTTTGNVLLRGNRVKVSGGSNAAGGVVNSTNGTLFGGSFHTHSAVGAKVKAGAGGTAKLTDLANISITAGNLTASAGSWISISGGGGAARFIDVTAKGTGASAATTVDAGVSIVAGNVTLKGHEYVDVAGGDYAGAGYAFSPSSFARTLVTGSSGGKATVNAKSVLNITAGGNLLASAAGSSVDISGGEGAGRYTAVTGNKGTAILTADGGMHVTAKGSVTLKSLQSSASIFAGDSAGYRASVGASSGTATETALGNVSITAGGAFTAVAASDVSIYGERFGAELAKVNARKTNTTAATLTADDSVNITAGGNVTLKAHDFIELRGGSSGARSAHMQASSGAAAHLSAKSSVTVKTGGNFLASAATSSVYMIAGKRLAFSGQPSNSSHRVNITSTKGSATLTADSGIHVAAAGAMTLTAHSSIRLFAHSAGGSHFNSAGYGAVVSATSGSAALTALANVSLKAGTTFTAAARYNMSISAGRKAGQLVNDTAMGSNAKAGVDVDTSVSITAGGNISLKGGTGIYISGGNLAGANATVKGSTHGAATLIANAAVNINAGGNLIANGGVSYVSFSAGADAGEFAKVTGNHGTATLTADAGMHVKAGANITVTGASSLYFDGHDNAGRSATVKGSSGSATLTALDNLTLTAGGAFTANAGSDVSIFGGSFAGYHAAVTAKGTGAKATLTADASAVIKVGGAMSLTAATNSVLIYGGNNAGEGAHVNGSSGGAATETTKANVSITVGGAFTANAGSSVSIYGASQAAKLAVVKGHMGTATLNAQNGVSIAVKGAMTLHGNSSVSMGAGAYAAMSASANATGAGGKASIIADTSLNITAASLTITAGTDASIYGGYEDAYKAKAVASSGGVSAKITTSEGATIKVPGAISIKAKDYLEIHAAYSNGIYASAHGNGGSASITATGAATLTAGGAFTASGGTGMSVGADYYNAYSDKAKASNAGGIAKVNALNSVKITAGGAVTMNGGSSNLSIWGNYSNAQGASVKGTNKGVASLTADGSVTVKGSSVSLTAGSSLSIYGRLNDAAAAHALASSSGSATLTAKAGVTIVTGGAFVAKAGNGLSIYASNSAGHAATVKATNATTKATLSVDESVNITAATVALTAGASSLEIYGGSAAGKAAAVTGKDHGVATETVNATVNITAAKAFSATMAAGAFSGNKLLIFGGASVGQSAAVTASSTGVATETTKGNVNIKVTAAGGTVTLKTGNQANNILSIYADNHLAYSAAATAHSGGAATLTAANGVAISALGTVTMAATHGRLSIDVHKDAGFGAVASAGTSKSKAIVNAGAAVSVKGGSVNLTAGGRLEIYGGHNGVGSGASAKAANGASAAVNIDARANVTATGNINATAGSGMNIFAGTSDNAHGAFVSAKHAAGSVDAVASLLSETDVNLKAGGSISLKAANVMHIHGSAIGLASGTASVGASDHAKATLTADGNVNITAGGAFTARGASSMSIYGGQFVADNAKVNAKGTGATATLTAQANVNLIVKGAVTLTAGGASSGNLEVFGKGSLANAAGAHGSSGATAALDAESKVAIKAGGAFTAGAGGFMGFFGANSAAKNVSETGKGTGTKVTLITNNGVSVAAGGNLTLTLHGSLLEIEGGGFGGRGATVTGSSAAVVTATIAGNVSLTAAGAWTENGAHSADLIAGSLAAASIDANVTGTATGTVNSGLVIKGTSVTVHHTGTLTKTPRTTIVDGSLTETGAITVTGSPVHLSVTPLSMAPVDDWSRSPMEVAPSTGGTSFGQPQSVGTMPGVSLTPWLSTSWALPGNSGVQIGVTPLPLADLGSQGLVVQLVTIAGLPADGEPAPSLLQAEGADFSSGSGFASLGYTDCRAVFQGDAGRCGSAGRINR